MRKQKAITLLRRILADNHAATAEFMAGRLSEGKWQSIIHFGECLFESVLPAAETGELRDLLEDSALRSGLCSALVRQELAERANRDRSEAIPWRLKP